MEKVITIPGKANQWQGMVDWLTKNVGPVLHSQPIIKWVGDGWTMYRKSEVKGAFGYVGAMNQRWEITIHDEKLATMFALTWV